MLQKKIRGFRTNDAFVGCVYQIRGESSKTTNICFHIGAKKDPCNKAPKK